jgi:molecular chaperone GrpE
MDDLDRALNAVRTATDVDALRAGVEMIDAKFHEVLRNKGVEEIEAVGKEFDVDLHEAVAKIPAPDADSKGKIIDVVQKGYKLKDKVVRYAKVVVGE